MSELHKQRLVSDPGCKCERYAVYKTNEVPREIIETNKECPMHGVPTFSSINDAQIEALAIDHIFHFINMIARARGGTPNIRVDECEMLLQCWRSIYAKVKKFKNPKSELIRQEASEIRDAIDCGDYDVLLMKAGEPQYVQRSIDTQAIGMDTVASAIAHAFIPQGATPEQLDEYALRTNPSRTREQVVREVNAASLSGFIGLVKCDACAGVGQTDGCSCIYCFGTGKREKQFTLEDLHTALNDLSIEHARR